MKLETKRLILRRPQPGDVADYMTFRNSEFVLRYNAMSITTPERAESYFARNCEQILLMEHKETGKVIGEICIQEDSLRYGVDSRELSYHLAEEFSRQGYMKEALRAVIEYLFTQEKMVCVSARCFALNEASLALLKSLGFHQDGCIPRCVKGYKDQIFDDTLHSLFPKDFA